MSGTGLLTQDTRNDGHAVQRSTASPARLSPISISSPDPSVSASSPGPDVLVPMSKDAYANNERLFPVFKGGLKNEEKYASSAEKLCGWLRLSKAFYPGARPWIVDFLETAQNTVRQKLHIEPEVSFHISQCPKTPASSMWLDPYVKLVLAVRKFDHFFVEPDLRVRLDAIFRTVDLVQPATGPALFPEVSISTLIPPTPIVPPVSAAPIPQPSSQLSLSVNVATPTYPPASPEGKLETRSAPISPPPSPSTSTSITVATPTVPPSASCSSPTLTSPANPIMPRDTSSYRSPTTTVQSSASTTPAPQQKQKSKLKKSKRLPVIRAFDFLDTDLQWYVQQKQEKVGGAGAAKDEGEMKESKVSENAPGGEEETKANVSEQPPVDARTGPALEVSITKNDDVKPMLDAPVTSTDDVIPASTLSRDEAQETSDEPIQVDSTVSEVPSTVAAEASSMDVLKEATPTEETVKPDPCQDMEVDASLNAEEHYRPTSLLSDSAPAEPASTPSLPEAPAHPTPSNAPLLPPFSLKELETPSQSLDEPPTPDRNLHVEQKLNSPNSNVSVKRKKSTKKRPPGVRFLPTASGEVDGQHSTRVHEPASTSAAENSQSPATVTKKLKSKRRRPPGIRTDEFGSIQNVHVSNTPSRESSPEASLMSSVKSKASPARRRAHFSSDASSSDSDAPLAIRHRASTTTSPATPSPRKQLYPPGFFDAGLSPSSPTAKTASPLSQRKREKRRVSNSDVPMQDDIAMGDADVSAKTASTSSGNVRKRLRSNSRKVSTPPRQRRKTSHSPHRLPSGGLVVDEEPARRVTLSPRSYTIDTFESGTFVYAAKQPTLEVTREEGEVASSAPGSGFLGAERELGELTPMVRTKSLDGSLSAALEKIASISPVTPVPQSSGLGLVTDPSTPPRGNLFNQEMIVLHFARGPARSQHVTLTFDLNDEQFGHVKAWTGRYSCAEDMTWRRCLSLACHPYEDSLELLDSGQTTMAPADLFAESPVTWPLRAHVRALINGEQGSGHKLLVTPLSINKDQLIDISAKVRSGTNTIVIEAPFGDTQDYVFVAHLHPPTIYQLEELQKRRDQENAWQQLLHSCTQIRIPQISDFFKSDPSIRVA